MIQKAKELGIDIKINTVISAIGILITQKKFLIGVRITIFLCVF